MYNFECGRWKRTGRTRNAVSWKLGQRVFGRDRDCGQGRTVERRKREERESVSEGGCWTRVRGCRHHEVSWFRSLREKDIVPLEIMGRKEQMYVN